VSHGTSNNAIHAHPRGELKRELIACPRHHNQVRQPRNRGIDRRGRILDMQSIPIRPAEVEERLIHGHLAIYSRDELDAIALSLNTRPLASLHSASPLVVYTQHTELLQRPTGTVN
jgi:IS30 family transposase